MNEGINWIVVKCADNLSTADMYKDLLMQEDIPVLIRSGGAAAYMGASAPQELLVPEDYVRKAQDILEGN
jgi:hypothetical protein